ncbi:MAG TPA: hypothetical protein VM581_04720, partial [Magnetospirillaceae bacterium]|nr:hypothetical protein [Magnetospirillaceae bacterium]
MESFDVVLELAASKVAERLKTDPNFATVEKDWPIFCRRVAEFCLCRGALPWERNKKEQLWQKTLVRWMVEVLYDLTSPSGAFADLEFNRDRLVRLRRNQQENPDDESLDVKLNRAQIRG